MSRAPEHRTPGSDRKARPEDLRLPPASRGLQLAAGVLFFLLGAAVSGFFLLDPLGLRGGRPPMAVAGPEDESPPAQLYQCPMHPQVIEAEPGLCPICNMRLVPMDAVAGGDESAASRVIEIDPVQVQNIGVVSVAAIRADVRRQVRTVGILDYNADDVTWINTKFSGWIEKVHASYVGQKVRTGDALFEIYSPELVSTQEEYLRALDYRASLRESGRREALAQAESLLRSTRDRLAYWDISEAQIQELETTRQVQRRLTIQSPVDGVVAQIMEQALEGIFVQPGMNLYKIADLSSVWVHAAVYESDLPWIRQGQPAEVSFPYDDRRSYRGEVLFLYPEVSEETRTLKICVQVPNDNERLRPGMYVDVSLQGPPVTGAILVPDSAILRSGQRELIFVDLGEGRFEPREVRLGLRDGDDRVQVLEGVEAGERVVTQAQFMLDSESRVREAIARFGRRHQDRKTSGTPEPRP